MLEMIVGFTITAIAMVVVFIALIWVIMAKL